MVDDRVEHIATHHVVCRRCGQRRRRFGLFPARFDHDIVAVRGDLADVLGRPTGARRDQATHDDVFLETDQLVFLALHRSLGENAGGFLERCRRDKGARLQRSLCNPQKNWFALCGTTILGNRLFVGLIELLLVHMLALEQRGVARILDLPLLQHLTHDDLDVLVVDLHTLQAIHVLHFVDHVIRQRFNTHNGKNVVRCRVTVHDVVALLHEVAFLHRDVFAFRHHVFHGFHGLVRRFNRDAALVLIVAAKAHVTIDFSDDRVVFWTTGFEQFGHTWQTTCNVLGLGAFTRDTRDNVTSFHILYVFNRQNCVYRHWVVYWVACVVAYRLTVCIHQDYFWLQLVAFWRGTPVGHDFLGHAGRVIGLIADRDTHGQINELRLTVFFRQNWQCVRIPFKHLVAEVDSLTIFDKQLGTVANFVAGTLFAVFALNDQLHVAAHHQDLAIGVLQSVGVFKDDLAFLACFQERLLTTLRNTTDVEGPHRQLCTGFTNRLCCDDTHGFASVHHGTTCKVTTVTHGADTFFCLTCQRAADPHGCHAGFVNCVRHALVDQLTVCDQNFVCTWLRHILSRNTAQNTLCQRRHNFTVIDCRFGGDRRISPTVMHTHNAVLSHVNQTTCQVTGVRSFQSGI
mmetsp:Transcript_18412/g.29908  ORF Transcript_18412/g.29908 Transcript_18412/m.29908 type:complete len:628 (-) Transcript_18412:6693-8576(-)